MNWQSTWSIYGKRILATVALMLFASSLTMQGNAVAQTKTWDGKHDTTKIAVQIVYYVPSDRSPLPDWKDRLEYYGRRIEQFHAREFQGQSIASTTIHPVPFESKWTTAELRRGDPNAIFFRTLSELDEKLEFGNDKSNGFPILLALSDINHRPLDDFYRLAMQDGQPTFEGIVRSGNHFPGSKLGGARATFLTRRGIGWGLVSADGWRVPYRGSDCVIYHEGLGHTVGLPHPEPGNRSVMSLAQYHGWLSESWIDDDQKERLAWKAEESSPDPQTELFTKFRAIPQPPQPRPGQPSALKLHLPDDQTIKTLRVRYQTTVDGPWIDVALDIAKLNDQTVTLGVFDRPTPVSYRVDVETDAGSGEIWGYFQVRNENNDPPLPIELKSDLYKDNQFASGELAAPPENVVDLIKGLDLTKCFATGKWTKEGGKLLSSKGYGVRLQIPFTPPKHYRITAIVEPLDKPNGLLLGLKKEDSRFVALFNHTSQRSASTALENVDGRNVGNETTYSGDLFETNRLSQVVVTVHKDGVQAMVDGRLVIDWKGTADQLTLSDYWKTPNKDSVFLGTYDCAYRFHRVTIEPL